jgi:hypothetical protein
MQLPSRISQKKIAELKYSQIKRKKRKKEKTPPAREKYKK